MSSGFLVLDHLSARRFLSFLYQQLTQCSTQLYDQLVKIVRTSCRVLYVQPQIKQS